MICDPTTKGHAAPRPGHESSASDTIFKQPAALASSASNEAIQSIAQNVGLFRYARNDLPRTSIRIPAARSARAFFQTSRQQTEGAGNAGCFAHPQPCVRKMKAHKLKSPQVGRNIPTFPARWFYGFFRALLGDRAFLPPSSERCENIATNLASASGCRDHTTSPSANDAARHAAQLTSIASRVPRS
jgi:hypothetical protein